MYRTHNLGELRIENVNQEVELSGWVQKIRNLGGMIFIDLRDQFGITQIVINDEKMQEQVKNVPTDKIVDRYARTMNLLLDAIKLVDRAYLFDNSSTHPILFATSQHDEISLVNLEYAPDWFQKYVIDKL
mgnify:CR=1 FL=1